MSPPEIAFSQLDTRPTWSDRWNYWSGKLKPWGDNTRGYDDLDEFRLKTGRFQRNLNDQAEEIKLRNQAIDNSLGLSDARDRRKNERLEKENRMHEQQLDIIRAANPPPPSLSEQKQFTQDAIRFQTEQDLIRMGQGYNHQQSMQNNQFRNNQIMQESAFQNERDILSDRFAHDKDMAGINLQNQLQLNEQGHIFQGEQNALNRQHDLELARRRGQSHRRAQTLQMIQDNTPNFANIRRLIS